MKLAESAEQVHQETGLTGDDLQAMTFAIAIGLAEKAGHDEAMRHFRQRLNETLARMGY